MAEREVQEVIRTIYFDRFRWSDWPAPSALEPFFLAPPGHEWSYIGGNDSWGINIKGLYGTSHLPDADQVRVSMAMIGHRRLGVYLAYRKWDGRYREQHSYNSRGDLNRLGEFVETLHETPLSVGLFVPFPVAWKAVKQFMENDGELPDRIEWIATKDLPPHVFPLPRGA